MNFYLFSLISLFAKELSHVLIEFLTLTLEITKSPGFCTCHFLWEEVCLMYGSAPCSSLTHRQHLLGNVWESGNKQLGLFPGLEGARQCHKWESVGQHFEFHFL